MSERDVMYMPRARAVRAYQYNAYSKEMVPGVLYKVGGLGGISLEERPYVWVGEDRKKYLEHDDWVVLVDGEGGDETHWVVLRPEVFEAMFVACEVVE